MRTIKLTHQEVETIKTALQYAYNRNLEMIKQNRTMLDENIVSEIIKVANKYLDTQNVFDGERDV